MVSLEMLRPIAIFCLIVLLGVAGRATAEFAEVSRGSSLPLGLPPLATDVEGPPAPAKIALGKQLFFDPRLSADKSISCASCHDPQQGWSNGARFATGIDGQIVKRSVPTVVNSVYVSSYFWDGRADTLEEVVPQPIEHPREMGLSMDEAVQRLNAIEGYRSQFQQTFGSDATRETLAEAVAAFLRTLVAGNAPFDRYRAGDLEALSPAARRGHDVFFFRANCQMCHRGPLLSDGGFYNLGVGMDTPEPDPGRAAVTGDATYDTGAFRTPSLRDLSRTGPYMHDGRFATLEEVFEFYEHAGVPSPFRMQMLNIVVLTDQEKQDLIVFLKEGLTSDDYPEVMPPSLPE